MPKIVSYKPIESVGEYIRPIDVKRCFGFSRTHAYNLMNAGLVKSKNVKIPGNSKGIRLIEVASLRALIANSSDK